MKKKIIKPSEKFAKVFQFDWDAGEDTSASDLNPIYQQRHNINPLFGRGYMAGIDMRAQRQNNQFMSELTRRRQAEERAIEDVTMSAQELKERDQQREAELAELRALEEAASLAIEKESIGLMSCHWSEKSLEKMNERDWRIFREDFDIRLKSGRCPNPIRFWTEASLPSEIMEALDELGWKEPSPIQRQGVPIGQQRKDMIGVAETGSGKTGAFLIPMLTFIMDAARTEMRERTAEQGPMGMVMAPTRELVQQIAEEAAKLTKFTDLKVVCVVGGQSIEDQAFQLSKGCHVLIATPGRLIDAIQNRYIVLNQCYYVVLDEADRMIDMGFEPQVVEILESIGGTLKSENEEEAELEEQRAREGAAALRITQMFSATMPTEVERLAKTYLRHPAVVAIGDEDTGKNKRIEQRVMFITEAQKKGKLMEILRARERTHKIMVFVNVKKNVDMITRFVEKEGVPVVSLHGGRKQEEREEALDYFRESTDAVLIATDVAGRGIDVPGVTHVVNYDVPDKIDKYCHRIGRTGRAGNDGIAISFVTDHDDEIMYDLKNYLQSTGMAVPAQLAAHPAAKAAPGARREDGSMVMKRKDTILFAK